MLSGWNRVPKGCAGEGEAGLKKKKKEEEETTPGLGSVMDRDGASLL